MSESALVTISEVPNYIAAYAANNALLAAINDEAMAGLSAGMPPTIALNGTRFVVKEGGEDKTLNQLELPCVILKAKPGIDKSWYAVKFVPGQEPQSPDCYSLNGLNPEPDSPNKQCDNCAGCVHNQFGSATDNSGNAMKGKACGDSKIMAIFANGGVYRFKIPAASLKNFVAYVKQLASHALFLPAVITTVGFDPSATYPMLTFRAQSALSEAQFNTVVAKISSQEVDDALMVKGIASSQQVGNSGSVAQAAVAQVAAQQAIADAAAKQAAAQAAAQAQAQAQAAAKATADAAAQATPSVVDGLDMDAALGFGTAAPTGKATKAPAKPKVVPAQAQAPVIEDAVLVEADPLGAATGLPTSDELSASLGL